MRNIFTLVLLLTAFSVSGADWNTNCDCGVNYDKRQYNACNAEIFIDRIPNRNGPLDNYNVSVKTDQSCAIVTYNIYDQDRQEGWSRRNADVGQVNAVDGFGERFIHNLNYKRTPHVEVRGCSVCEDRRRKSSMDENHNEDEKLTGEGSHRKLCEEMYKDSMTRFRAVPTPGRTHQEIDRAMCAMSKVKVEFFYAWDKEGCWEYQDIVPMDPSEVKEHENDMRRNCG